MRSYFLRTSKTTGNSPLYVQVKSRVNNFRLQINTNVIVSIEDWQNAERKSAGKANKSVWDYMPKSTKEIVAKIDDAITFAMEQPDCTKESVESAVAAVRYATTMKEQKAIEEKQQREIESEKAKKAKDDADVMLYLSELIQKMKNGEAVIERGQNVGEKYTKGTIKSYTNIQKVLQEFLKGRRLTWNDITKEWAIRFINFMEKRGLMKKTVNRYATTMKAVIMRAYDDGKHNDERARGYFVKRKIDKTDKATEIYLTADELQALYEMKLSGLKEQVRDIFLIGCYTCQRVSDYSKLKRENFTTTARGTQIIRLRQQKTGTEVQIPILSKNLITLAEKYDFNLPVIRDVIINRYIKTICKDLAASVPSLAVESPTILTMKEKDKEDKALRDGGKPLFKRNKAGVPVKAKYEMITTHTARRSGITLMYLSRKFDLRQMMHVSGHRDVASFNEYIKLSGDDVADEMSEKLGNEDLF